MLTRWKGLPRLRTVSVFQVRLLSLFSSPPLLCFSYFIGFVAMVGLRQREADGSLNITVPYMDSTHHLIDAKFIASMKKGSRIVNTARGAVVHETALIEALQSGHLLSAGLDVHYNEPRVAPELIALVGYHDLLLLRKRLVN